MLELGAGGFWPSFSGSNMAVRRDDGSQNEHLQNVVARLLDETGHHGLRQIRVDVEEGRIVLSGSVPSYFLKQMAQETARQACPNRKVDNDLEVAAN